MKKVLLGIFIVLIIGGGLAYIKVRQIQTLIATPIPTFPESVSTSEAHLEQWPDTLSAIGSVSAAQGVTVAPEIAGTVSEILFESGATVQKGDLLVKLDTSSEEAQLRAILAQVKLSKLTAQRNHQLQQDKTVSQSEVDSSDAALEENQANADNIQAIINKKTIRAPFSGKLGIRLIDLGESLNVGQGIVSLQALKPVYVDFSLPQEDLARLHTGLKVQAITDSYPDKKFAGELMAINPDLDATTRSVKIRAKYDNADELLRPGMFVRVAVEFPDAQPVLVIPATAVLSAPYGDSVFIITGTTNHLTVDQKLIRTGRTRGDFVTVESGLQAGDKVVSAGVFKLRKGVTVVEKNDIVPPASNSPTPPNS